MSTSPGNGISSNDQPGHGAAGVRDFGHMSIAVADIEDAVSFFETAFGFEVLFSEFDMSSQIEAMTGAFGMRCHLVQMRHPGSSHPLELIEFIPEDGKVLADELPIRPGASHVSLRVENIRQAREIVEKRGGSVLGEITDFDSGQALYCRVPGGAFVELEQAVHA